jgi:hypothetical protein
MSSDLTGKYLETDREYIRAEGYYRTSYDDMISEGLRKTLTEEVPEPMSAVSGSFAV